MVDITEDLKMSKMFLCVASRGRYEEENGKKIIRQHFEIRTDAEKYTNTITTVEKDNYIICQR